MTLSKIIYKITPRVAWEEAEKAGVFTGAPIDIADGYIHFSTAEQARETAAKHFAGQGDLLLAAIDVTQLGDDLKWEISRGDALFPHLYSELKMDAVIWAKPMPLGKDGVHQFPDMPEETEE